MSVFTTFLELEDLSSNSFISVLLIRNQYFYSYN